MSEGGPNEQQLRDALEEEEGGFIGPLPRSTEYVPDEATIKRSRELGPDSDDEDGTEDETEDEPDGWFP